MLDILQKTLNILWESWLVLGQMAPYLLLGFLLAGILSVFVSPSWVERHVGRRGWGSVLKASLFGVPLPLCSCGVIPVSASIRRHGASRAATAAFLLSTPQTGVDSIAITFRLLGPVFAVYRPIVALLTGLAGGWLVQLFDPSRRSDAPAAPSRPQCHEVCCAETAPRNALLRAVQYGFVTLPRDIGRPLLVGILIAGAIAALAPENRLGVYIGGGVPSILLLMTAAVPIYVCATASVPIAVGLIHLGASPGAALAFLIAGPATNAATFTTLWKLLGRGTALLYLAIVAISALAGGLLLDWLFAWLEAATPPLGTHAHLMAEGGWGGHLWAGTLLGVLAGSSRRIGQLRRAIKGSSPAPPDAGPAARQQQLDLRVAGMTCSHCAESVRRALAECDGVRSAEVDLGNGHAWVAGDHLDRGQLLAAVAELGYAASLAEEPTA